MAKNNSDTDWKGYAVTGGSVFGAITNMIVGGRNRRIQQQWEQYRNSMRNIGAGIQQDAVTVNQIHAITDSRRKSIANQLAYEGARGTLAVQQAVSGFNGRTADAIKDATFRAEALRQTNIDTTYARQERVFDMQRLNIAFGNQVSLEDGWVEPVNYVGEVTNVVSTAAKSFG